MEFNLTLFYTVYFSTMSMYYIFPRKYLVNALFTDFRSKSGFLNQLSVNVPLDLVPVGVSSLIFIPFLCIPLLSEERHRPLTPGWCGEGATPTEWAQDLVLGQVLVAPAAQRSHFNWIVETCGEFHSSSGREGGPGESGRHA